MNNDPAPRQPAAAQDTSGYVVSHGPGWNPQAPNPTSAASILWQHIHRAHHSHGQAS